MLPELQDNAPIPVEVCFVKMWGAGPAMPGMGVRFIELSKLQHSELVSLSGRGFMLE